MIDLLAVLTWLREWGGVVTMVIVWIYVLCASVYYARQAARDRREKKW